MASLCVAYTAWLCTGMKNEYTYSMVNENKPEVVYVHVALVCLEKQFVRRSGNSMMNLR